MRRVMLLALGLVVLSSAPTAQAQHQPYTDAEFAAMVERRRAEAIASLLSDPCAVVFDALVDEGLNPWGVGILTRRALERAWSLVAHVLPEIEALPSPDVDSARMVVRAQVRRATSGQSVFLSPSQLRALPEYYTQRVTLGGAPETVGQRAVLGLLSGPNGDQWRAALLRGAMGSLSGAAEVRCT